MNIKNMVVSLLAAAGVVSCATAGTQVAAAPDPNLAPSTTAAEAQLQPTPADEPQVAAAPDPNEGSSTTGEEAQLPLTPSNGAQTANAPDPNIAPSTGEANETSRSGTMGSSAAITH